MDDNKITHISKLILQSTRGMVHEQDIVNLFSSIEEYSQAIKEIVNRFRSIGLTLVRTEYEGKQYFVVSSPGKDEQVSPAMYGVLGIIIAMYNEIGSELSVKKLKKVLNDVWTEVELLIEANYLAEIKKDNEMMLMLTPIAKAATRKIAKELNIRDLIDTSNNKIEN